MAYAQCGGAAARTGPGKHTIRLLHRQLQHVSGLLSAACLAVT